MITHRPSAKSIDEAAARWVARLDAGALTPAEETELTDWLDSDIRCVGAMARAQAYFVSPRMELAMRILRRPPAPSVAQWGTLPRRAVLMGAAASVLGAAVLVRRPAPAAGRRYASEVGEVRRIPLPDGSRITLNTDSVLEVDYREDSRTIRLLKGEAYFEVAKNPDRPFVVEGPKAQARAVGTAYAVRLEDDKGGMRVQVTSGRVAVELPPPAPPATAWQALERLWTPSAGATNGTHVTANQEAEVRIGLNAAGVEEVQVSLRDVAPGVLGRSLMWREGLLSFEGVTLAEAAAEFARYSVQKIVVKGPPAHERISGLFAATDPAGFARAIALGLRIKSKREGDVITLYK
ncbi:FecR family protein [Nitrospirillum viridazoti]|uniref:FecR family protein n=1 Tax=Nitrospirillum viridazoti TaxID=3144925 RepID=UPI000A51519A|nr:FecR domain-containing protein [Nitrospirillum amazonense]TWB33654.1 FecR family protein [Nitrospirillum amazonense]